MLATLTEAPRTVRTLRLGSKSIVTYQVASSQKVVGLACDHAASGCAAKKLNRRLKIGDSARLAEIHA